MSTPPIDLLPCAPTSSAGHVVLHTAILPEGAAPLGPPQAPSPTPTPPHWHARAAWTQGQGVCCLEPWRAGTVQE